MVELLAGAAGADTEGVDRVIVEWAVRDSGPGISTDQQERLFEPFQQGPTALVGKFGGTGLGLRIARRLVEAS